MRTAAPIDETYRRIIYPSVYGSSYPPQNTLPLYPPQRLPNRSTKVTTKLVLFPQDPTEVK